MTEQLKQALIKDTERHIAQDILYDDVYVGPFTEKDGIDCAIHAVDWYLNNMWHSTIEDPEERKDILLMYKASDGRKIYHIGLFDSRTRKVLVSQRTSFPWQQITHFEKWAYIEDLLPDKNI